MKPKIEIPAERRRQAYDLYKTRSELTLNDIAAFLAVSSSTFVRLRQLWGWPPRQAALAQGEADRAATDRGETLAGHGEAAASLHEAVRSLARTTRLQIDALLEEQRAGRVTDHDKSARALASYAKTLTTARALLEQEGSRLDDTGHHDDEPRSIYELRDELARHLDRVIAEEEARGSDGLLV